MADCNHCTHERALSVEDDVTVAFYKVDSHDKNSAYDRQEPGTNDRAPERIHLRSKGRASCEYDEEEGGDDDEQLEGARGNSLESSGEEKTSCPPAFCVRNKSPSPEGRSARARTYSTVSIK